MRIVVEELTADGYIKTLKAAAKNIEERAGELIGNVDNTTGVELTIKIEPGSISTIVAKKTINVIEPEAKK